MIRMSIFKNINLTSKELFIDSIYKVKEILNNTTKKLIINEDTTLYRAISSNNDINNISKSNIISTSLSFGETLNFANAGENITLHQINIKKGSHVACIPYAILNDTKTHRIILTNKKDQEEILLNKEIYEFEELNKQIINNIEIIEVNAKDITLSKGR